MIEERKERRRMFFLLNKLNKNFLNLLYISQCQRKRLHMKLKLLLLWELPWWSSGLSTFLLVQGAWS